MSALYTFFVTIMLPVSSTMVNTMYNLHLPHMNLVSIPKKSSGSETFKTIYVRHTQDINKNEKTLQESTIMLVTSEVLSFCYKNQNNYNYNISMTYL